MLQFTAYQKPWESLIYKTLNAFLGPTNYLGQPLKKYKISVCKICYGGNWDGWNPANEKILLKHMEKNKLAVPKRNEKGFLPRE